MSRPNGDGADLAGLLADVEKASGPDAGIDGRIALGIEGWAFHFGGEYDERWSDMAGHWLPPEGWLHEGSPFECRCKSDIAFDVPPDYTASLDAALALCERVCADRELHPHAVDLLNEALEEMLVRGWWPNQPQAPQIARYLIAALLRALVAQDAATQSPAKNAATTPVPGAGSEKLEGR
jgi:hypothetical protein